MVSQKNLIAAIIFAALVAGGVLYWQHRRIEKAENEAGLASSRILSAIFTATSELKVARLHGEVLARVEGASVGGMFTNNQETIAPYSIDYFVDLRRLPRTAYRWNAKERIMSVDIPDVMVSRPNIDMSQARTKQGGLFISRWSSMDMQKRAAGRLADRAEAKGKDAEYTAKTRALARAAITRFVEAPLAAAGLPGVKVVVRLPGDDKPDGLSEEQWDVSRSITEVLADFR